MSVGHTVKPKGTLGEEMCELSNKRRRTGRLAVATVGVLTVALMVTSLASAATNFPLWRSGESPIAYGKPVVVGATSIKGLNLHFRDNNSMEMWVQCSQLTTKGTVENPGAAKPGVYKSSGASFGGCELVELGESSVFSNPPLACTIAKEMPAEVYNAALTNVNAPSGALTLGVAFTFVVTCPNNVKFSEPVKMTGAGRELWPGQLAFEAKDTTVTGLSGKGEGEFGFGVSSTSVPVTIGEKPYEEPKSTSGHLWYRGGAERTVTEGPPVVIGAGTQAALSGGRANVAFESVQAGVIEKIKCGTGTVGGSVENPVGGGPGVASVGLALSNCTVVKPEGKNCSVVGSSINLAATTGEVSSEPSFPTFVLGKIEQERGSYTVANCTLAALNHAYAIRGKMFIRPQMRAASTPGSWAVSAELTRSSGLFYIQGQRASAEGEITAESGGEVVTVG
jgi:hypothetical protein